MIPIARVLLPAVAALMLHLPPTAHAAPVDINKASQAELESLKGIGPGMSARMVGERRNGDFKDWHDVVNRIQGVGPAKAAKFSAQGLRVNGTSYSASAGTTGGLGAGGGKHRGKAAAGTAQGVITTVSPRH